MTRVILGAAVAAALGGAQPAPAIEVCIDPGAPISASTGQIFLNASLVKATGAKWVRVNFILGPWSSPTDTTRRGPGNLTWKETYDTIINSLRAQGMEIYALIGAEAVKTSYPLNSQEYVDAYVQNFQTIVGQFRDRIRVFESFNEPNDWAGGTTAQVQPYWFAKMLKEIYTAVKIADGRRDDPSWQVTLVSGPLFTHDLDTGASYISQTYQEGISKHGWNAFRSQYGTYPLDGFGFHIYVKQGPNTEQAVQNGLNTNLNAFWNAVTAYEGSGTAKRLWISEFGWNTAHVSEAEQARNLTLAFNLFKNDSRVHMANWFQISDFGPNDKWGLFRGAPFDDSNKKPSWQAFYDFAIAQLPQGSVSGFVRDTSGAPVPDARVEITGDTRFTTSGADGSYTIGGLPAGQYTLEAKAFGYRSQTRVVNLTAGGSATANFSLLKASSVPSPADAKTLGNTFFVRLDGLVVSAVFPPDRVYAQRPDRSSGIALMTGAAASPGDIVSATGYMLTVDGERVASQAEILITGSAGSPPPPLFFRTAHLGGRAQGNQLGVVDDAVLSPPAISTALNNIGLRVSAAGRVTYVDAAQKIFYLDDGAGLRDGSGQTGVRVWMQSGTLPAAGSFVRVTGISGATLVGGNVARLLRVPGPGGVEPVTEP